MLFSFNLVHDRHGVKPKSAFDESAKAVEEIGAEKEQEK